MHSDYFVSATVCMCVQIYTFSCIHLKLNIQHRVKCAQDQWASKKGIERMCTIPMGIEDVYLCRVKCAQYQWASKTHTCSHTHMLTHTHAHTHTCAQDQWASNKDRSARHRSARKLKCTLARLQICFQDAFKMLSRCFQDAFKMLSRCFQTLKTTFISPQ